jgi:hypothetical protein
MTIPTNNPGRCLCRRATTATVANRLTRAQVFFGLLIALAAWLFSALPAAGAELRNNFADRELATEFEGVVTGNNTNATRETNEPQHADKPGGRSVWVSWIAPTNGVATFRTTGSTFDTLLAAYYFKRINDTTLDELEEAASNDDDTVAPASVIRFGAEAGVRYEIAIDGYRGAEGDIRLEWEFTEINTIAPVVVDAPKDRALRLGDSLTLAVNLQSTPDIRLQWRFNGDSFGAEGPTLFIPSLQLTNVGRYSLRIRIGDGGDEVRFETAPVEIQINSEGQTNALARDKIFDAVDSPLTPDDHGSGASLAFVRAASASFAAASVGVSRGYNGAQVFNTTYATPDPNEPQHCGVTGGASYWFAYEPPTNGTLHLDTIGSLYDTVLAAYEIPTGEFTFPNLISLACDNDGVALHGPSSVQIQVVVGKQYLVAVDGVGGARGIAQLNYRLEGASSPPSTNVSAVFAAGSYYGVFLDTNAVNTDSTGFMKLTLGSKGTFTASIRQAQHRLSFSGRFDSNGWFTTEVVRRTTNSLTLEMNYDLVGSLQVTSQISAGSWNIIAPLHRAVFHRRSNPATNFPARYTLLMPGAADGNLAPVGDGPVALSVNHSGTISAAGLLSDGSAFSQSVPVSTNGNWPLFAIANRGRSIVAGNLRLLSEPNGENSVEGTAHWLRLAGPKPSAYTNGFLLASAVAGSAYTNPGPARVLTTNSALLTLTDATGATVFSSPMHPGPGSRLTNGGPDRLAMTVSAKTGLMRGTVVFPGANRSTALRGVVLQQQQLGGGYFVRSNSVGRLALE